MKMELFKRLMQDPDLWKIFMEKELTTKASGQKEKDQDAIMSPVISEFLIRQGYEVSYPGNKKFALCLTHDVDDIYPPFSHRVASSLWSIKKRNWRGVKEYLLWNKNKPSPYVNFQKIMDLERKYGAKSTFFFMATSRDPKRFRYHIEDIKGELPLIARSGWEVGLHGGYDSFHDDEAIKKEKARLEKALGRKVIGYRNHYLRFQIPDTWDYLERCGFEYDSTFGYNDTVGFRGGMCHPFRPYDNLRQRWMNICEIPLTVMESAMVGSIKPGEAWELIKKLLEEVEANRGVLTVLWHNYVFNCPFREYWSDLYERILQYGNERDAWMTSGEELWRYWKENGY
jgi:peptidoglycan/xylan/chitin deacetylase (PgdA/CDA1 family)